MYIRRTAIISLLLSSVVLVNCVGDLTPGSKDLLPPGTTYIPPSPQRDGDAAAGLDYLINGDYMNSGIPYEAYIAVVGPNYHNVLGRSGESAVLDFEVTAVQAPNGVTVVAQNCLKCHGGHLNGEFVLGLGAAHYDYTFDYSTLEPATSNVIRALYGEDSPEWEAYEPFRRSGEVIGPYLVTETFGVNPADKIWTILAAHRDKFTLEWKDEPETPIAPELVPTDVPPWWYLKKKHAMFYSGYGRQDFCRIMMASSMLTLRDSSKAREIDGKFNDVFAYLKSIEPPEYPWEIDQHLADQGGSIFNEKCASCHGTYGEPETFPNLFVDLDQVGTDPALANSYLNNPVFVNWFNDGWFGVGPSDAKLVAQAGYVAPPLDGIWATAPYLHNGSIPDLNGLIDPDSRPEYWRRNFNSLDYNPEKVGWNYEEKSFKVDKKTYDTTLPGYWNSGHDYGNSLSSEEKNALLEYLKTI